MNKLFSVLVFGISISLSNCIFANEAQTFKCYVEMVGGGEHIHSIIYPSGGMRISQVEQSMIGHIVYFNGSKVPIYRVNECVFEDKKFSSNIAIDMDKNRDPL